MSVRTEQVLVVDVQLRGVQLADFLERHLPPTHRTYLRQLVTGGQVRLNGEPCTSNRRLRAGDVVQVPPVDLPARGQAQSEPPAVRFESATCLVIEKPAGLATVPDRTGQEAGVHGLLPALRPGADLRIVHRLDRDTSGCLLMAKGLEAARHFDEAFRSGAVRKTYAALVHGLPTNAQFSIDAWLGPDPKRRGKVLAARAEQRGFRAAHTAVQLRTAYRNHALLQLQPTTGRTHQLRVHLASIGHPIVGDRDYGGEPLLLSSLKSGYKLRRGTAERPLVGRMFLHAERLVFPDVDGGLVDVDVPLPFDLATALQKLENFDEPRR